MPVGLRQTNSPNFNSRPLEPWPTCVAIRTTVRPHADGPTPVGSEPVEVRKVARGRRVTELGESLDFPLLLMFQLQPEHSGSVSW